MDKRKKYKILFGIFLGVFVASAGYCTYYYVSQNQKEQIYEELSKEVRVPETPKAVESADPTPTPKKEKVKEKAKASKKKVKETKVKIPIDFAQLQQQNPDVYAWIQIPDTAVDYPIMQSASDNAYYLNHTVTGAEGYPGSIYTENLNSQDFTDKNTVIYGHNMDDGTMFGGLHQYVDPAYMSQHSEIYIYTPEHKYTYKVFAAVTYDNRHILETYNCNEEAQFQDFLDSVMSVQNIASQYSSDIVATSGDRIITLSTCNGNSEQRFLVEAVLSNEE